MMTSDDVILDTIENAYEWLEMSPNPTAMVVGILANRIVKLHDHIEYLERRLHHVSINKR